MELVNYQDTKAFFEDNKVTLEENALQLNLFWRNIETGKTAQTGLFAAKVFHEEGVLLAIQTDDFPMVLYSQGGQTGAMAEKLVEHLQGISFPAGVNGLPDAVKAYVSVCHERGVEYTAKHELDLMVCSKLSNIPTRDCEFKYIKDVNFDLSDYVYGFYQDCKMGVTESQARENARKLQDSDMLLCCLEGRDVISVALLDAPLKIVNAICISLVYTPPRF